MDESRQQIVFLLQKHLQKELTDKEQDILMDWAQQCPENQQILDRIAHMELFAEDLQNFISFPTDSERTFAHIWKKELESSGTDTVISKKMSTWRWLPYAAASVILLIFFTILSDTPENISVRKLSTLTYSAEDNSDNKDVTITFSDGSSIALDPQREGIQTLDKHIYYEDGGGVLSADHYEYLTVNVPRGNQFQVTLPDGTQVHLNAESSMKYPVAFSPEERRVELKGEAYFAVAKQFSTTHDGELVPFLVDFDRYEVKVHGTEFNIQKYDNQAVGKVSLVSGKVSVHGKGERLTKGVFLSPGQEIRMEGEKVSVQKANLANDIAWKDGLFSFEGKKLSEVMNELERWYDIDVVYEGEIPDVTFFGRAYRKEELVSILHLLKSADITYRLLSYDGRRRAKLIIVNKRKEGSSKM